MRPFLILLSFFTFSSCLDQLELQPAKGLENGVVIQGELIKGTPSIIKVKVSQLFNFDIKAFAPIQVKSVVLIDEKEQEMNVPLRLTGLYQQVIEDSDLIKVSYGNAYKIRVELENGIKIGSEYETLLPSPPKEAELRFRLDTTTVQTINEEIQEVPVVQFSVNTPIETIDKNRKAKLLWMTERTYQITDSLNLTNFPSKTCYITSSLDVDKLYLLNGDDLTTNKVSDFPLSNVVLDSEFAEGYYYTIYRRALTDKAFDYYSRMKQVVERSGNMFEPPVGLLPSNMSNLEDAKDNNIYGYFTTFQQDTFRLYVSPMSVGNPTKLCPPGPNVIFRCPYVCCDCLIEPGSQVIKPDFWEE